MRKELVTAATFTAVEREVAKLRPELRVGSSADDRVIDDLILSATEAYQGYTGNILCSSAWDLHLDRFPRGREFETPAYLADVESITYTDTAGNQQTIAPTVYGFSTTDAAGRIYLKDGQWWDSPACEPGCIVVRATLGYPNANAIPQTIKDGLYAYMQAIYYGVSTRSAYDKWMDFKRRWL